MSAFDACPIADRVHWVGAVDYDLRDFHGYLTGRGSTYNAFLVLDDKVALIDTVKAPMRDEFLARLRAVIDPARIDYLISLHSEMDHSGCLVETAALCPNATVLASPNGVTALRAHFGPRCPPLRAVKDGEVLDLGSRRLTFLTTAMIHWPDSMMAHLSGSDLLFSQDGFGQHLASSERFDDQVGAEVLRYETAKYYANILLPFSGLVVKLLDKLAASGLKVATIAPDHGVVWRVRPQQVLDWTRAWARRETQAKAVVLSVTMWGSTERMAHAIADGLIAGGLAAKVMSVTANHRSDVATEVLDAAALVVGSPTMNNQIHPALADHLTYLKGLKPTGLIGGAFGSHGWSGEAPRHIQEALTAMAAECPLDPLQVRYVPTAEDLERCHAFGVELAAKVRARRAG